MKLSPHHITNQKIHQSFSDEGCEGGALRRNKHETKTKRERENMEILPSSSPYITHE
jgi:hypothetical protein